MKQYGFHFDASRCTGCKTCVVSCKDKNNLGTDRAFRHVLEEAEGEWKQDPATGAWNQNVISYFVSVSCNQCTDPACIKVCPTGAHAKHFDLGGLVLIDSEKCIGCGACAYACPYGAPQLDQKAGKMTKCNACYDRLAIGRKPTCVEACPQRALDFDYVDVLKEKYGDDGLIAPLARPDITKPNLLITACEGAQPPLNKRWSTEYFEQAVKPNNA